MSMTVKHCILIVSVVMAVMLCACAENKDTGKGRLDELKKKMEENVASAEESGEPQEKRSSKEQNDDAKEGKTAGLFARAFADGTVENNGGAFVRAGNRIYFRVYNTRSLAATTLGGLYIDEVSAAQPSTLKFLDLDTDEEVEVCEVYGTGPLYVTQWGICIASYTDGVPSTTLIDEDGNIDEDYLPAVITGVSADGRLISVSTEPEDRDDLIPVLYNGDSKIGSPADDGEEDRHYNAYGFVGNSMIGITSRPESMIVEAFSYDENGRFVILGQVGHYDMETYTLSPHVEKVTGSDEEGYISATYRDGTADAVVAWAVFEFTAGAEDSMKELDSDLTSAKYDHTYPEVIFDKKGRAKLSAHGSNEVYLSERYFGDLMCTDEDENEMLIRNDYISDPGDERKYITAVADGAYFADDIACFIELDGKHNEEEDAGFHRAYDLTGVRFICLRFDDDHLNQGGFPSHMLSDNLYSSGWDKGDIDYSRLVGEWEAFYLNVDGSEQDVGGNPEMIRFNEDGSAVTFIKDSKTGKISRKRQLHRGEADEYMDNDYAYVYYSDDEDPLRGGVCTLSHNVLKMFYLYHFDGTSTGTYTIKYRKVE